jgi:flagellar motor switch protein FliG
VPGEAPQSKASKVAKLLVLLGRDEAAAVLSHLSEAEIEEVARHIASLETVDRESASQILSEFGFQMETRPAVGGREVARAILARAFPSSQVEDILFRALGEKRRFFAFLEELQGPQIRALIKDESPAVVAVVLSNMSPQAAAKTLAVLPEDLRTSVVLRIAATSQVDAAVVRRVEESLRLKADSLGKMESENVDGPSALAGILRYMELDKEEALLRELESTDAELASEIEDRLFTVDTLLLLDDRQLANVLASYSDRDLALVLKGKEEEVRRKVLENLSERRRQIVAEEYRFLGPVPRREVSEATGRLLSDLRRMESEGTLIVHRDGEKYI